MLNEIPSNEKIESLVGQNGFNIWTALCTSIDSLYDMEHLWSSGGKQWEYEYKYRRGGKTLCAMYIRHGCLGFMIIFGRYEREKFEITRQDYSDKVQRIYDEAKTYHDGKWVMFEPQDTTMIDDLVRLLAIKRKPNKKQ